MYGRVYPLFTPAMFMLPFQIMRESRREYGPGEEIPYTSREYGYLEQDGSVTSWPRRASTLLEIYVANRERVYVENLPRGMFGTEPNIVFLDQDFHVISFEDKRGSGQYYTGVIDIPADVYYISILESTNLDAEEPVLCKVYEAEPTGILDVQQFSVYDKNGSLVGDFTQQIKDAGLTVEALTDYDVIVFGGQAPVFTQFANGQYYAVLSDGVETWYSEVFTVVNDITPYLKIEWWDNEDFVMDAGTIVYNYAGGTQFRNVLYLQADIAKPEYVFEEEGESRDGYFFPTKQISEKKYRFSFLASEYLLDVMRFIRMADYAYIEKNGQRYSLDTFLITPEWEDNGDVASVAAEFETATVAKKIGQGYIKAQRGDFNDDFNNDYNNQ